MSLLFLLYFCIFYIIRVDSQEGNVRKLVSKWEKKQTHSHEKKLAELSKRLNGFAFQLYERLSVNSDAKSNMAFSPFSIFIAFSSLSIGAKGKTREEMIRSLHLGKDQKLLKHMRPWNKKISKTNEGKSNLYVANKAWVSNNTKILRGYRKIIKEYFHMKFQKIDVTKPDESLKIINGWVAKKTHQMIPELFPSGSIGSLTKLLLANAVYFNGTWADKFNEEDTGEGTFCVNENSACEAGDNGNDANDDSVSVRYMMKKATFPMGYFDEVRVLELPYTGDLISMYFVSPGPRSNISNLEKQMNPGRLRKMRKKLTNHAVIAYVPKFKIKHEFDLNGDILNMQRAFDPNKADLSGITDSKELYISKAFHKTHLQVDEAGTVAASSTGIVIQGRSYTPEVRLNRPFLFYVVHKSCGAIIFSGKVMNPNS